MTIVSLLLVIALLVMASVVGWVVGARLRYGFCLRRMGEEVPRQSPGNAVRYYLGIFRSILLTGWWRLRALGRDGLRQPAGETTGPLVLCVHGFLMNGTCFWGIRRALEAAGRPTRAVSMGRPHRPIDAYAPVLRQALEEIRRESPEVPVDVVTHSMGGLVLRRVLQQDPSLGDGLRRIVTLATPHQGTPISGLLPGGPEVRQMARGSEFLRRLPDFRTTTPATEVIAVASTLDLVVFPPAASLLPGARAEIVEGVAHIGLLTESAAVGRVVELLSQPTVEL